MEDLENFQRTLARIESFLLPTTPAFLQQPLKSFPSTPNERLDEILYDLVVAEHVRAMQTTYRDVFDELSLALELRGTGLTKDSKMPTKEILNRLVEGRVRALALVKLCYGPTSVILVRSYIDLANAYALQAHWQQAEEHIMTAQEKLVEAEAASKMSSNTFQNRKLALSAAKRICIVYNSLRKHVVNNCGQINASFIKELLTDMSEIMSSTDTVDTHMLPHPSKLFQSLNSFFTTPSSKLPLKQLNKAYFPDSNTGNAAYATGNKLEVKTWGEMIEFFRTKCEVMKQYVDCAVTLLLPQTKALLTLPFRHCDPQSRNLAHPIQLSNAIQQFPSTLKALGGVKLGKLLAACRAEVPLLVNALTGSVQTLPQPNVSQQGVFYELPMTLEEYLSMYMLASSQSLDNQFGLLKAQTLTLKGVCSLHQQKLEIAEEVLLKALQELENVGLEGELIACELYNSIAQLMITKHQSWLDSKKERLYSEAEKYVIDDEEGRKLVQNLAHAIKKQYDYKSNIISVAEIEHMAKHEAIRKRVKELHSLEDNDATKQSLEAAYRYLVKSFDIVESTHGCHAIVGTACVAVASVQNLLKDFEETREWLLRAIRIFEKCVPTPLRAISFAQTQLANALSKLGHESEGRKVLNLAAQFHLSSARMMLTSHLSHKPQPENNLPSSRNIVDQIWPIILKGSPLYDEIQIALSLLTEVMRRSSKIGEKWEASLIAEEIAKLVEDAYGWDSIEAAEAYKQVGVKCMQIEDHPRAVRFLSLAHASFLSLFPKTEGRCVGVGKLLEEARQRREQGNAGLLPEEEHELLEREKERLALRGDGKGGHGREEGKGGKQGERGPETVDGKEEKKEREEREDGAKGKEEKGESEKREEVKGEGSRGGGESKEERKGEREEEKGVVETVVGTVEAGEAEEEGEDYYYEGEDFFPN